MRIDYEPDRGTSSLALRAFRDGSWVGSAFVSPRLGRDNDRLQQVIDVLTERGTNARELSRQLRAVSDGAGELARPVIEWADAEFTWPGEPPSGDGAFDSANDGAKHDQRPPARRTVPSIDRAGGPAQEDTPDPPAHEAPAPRGEPWYPPSSNRDAPVSEVFASRADMEPGEPRDSEVPARSVVVRLPNGTPLVLPAATDAPLSHLLGRTLASSTEAAQAVRRHAEDLLAAAERVCQLTAASIPGFDMSSRHAWLRGAQLLVSWRMGDAGTR